MVIRDTGSAYRATKGLTAVPSISCCEGTRQQQVSIAIGLVVKHFVYVAVPHAAKLSPDLLS
jgi:hypothetical protein